MAKKEHYLIIDTETTCKDHVVDFGAVVVDRKGRIHRSCAVLIKGIFDREPLFSIKSADNGDLWSTAGQTRRMEKYRKMLDEGSRMLCSVAAINRWLEKVNGMYKPYLTAYNLAFDVDKMGKTMIDHTIFRDRFCLWHASAAKWGSTKAYKNFVLQSHAFNAPTDLGNMTFQTNAEIMARFVIGDHDLPAEPHTALEDVIGYELPILVKLVNSKGWKKFTSASGYDWKSYQVRDHFEAK